MRRFNRRITRLLTEYAATVYVIDFIKNGETILTKEKYNIDGPY